MPSVDATICLSRDDRFEFERGAISGSFMLRIVPNAWNVGTPVPIYFSNRTQARELAYAILEYVSEQEQKRPMSAVSGGA